MIHEMILGITILIIAFVVRWAFYKIKLLELDIIDRVHTLDIEIYRRNREIDDLNHITNGIISNMSNDIMFLKIEIQSLKKMAKVFDEENTLEFNGKTH